MRYGWADTDVGEPVEGCDRGVDTTEELERPVGSEAGDFGDERQVEPLADASPEAERAAAGRCERDRVEDVEVDAL